MSDIHIKEKDPKNKTVNCIFHIDVPDENNAVGTNWRGAVQRSLNPVAQMPWNDSAENASIEAGAIFEKAHTVRFSGDTLTNAQKLAEVEAVYNDQKTVLLNELKDQLDFFGKEV